MFNVAIIGSDGAGSYKNFRERCIYYLKNKASEGITIMATEEHEYIKKFAMEFGLNIQFFYTDWKSYGKNALKERNKQLISNSAAVIYFDDGLKDTLMIRELAKKTGIPVRTVKK